MISNIICELQGLWISLGLFGLSHLYVKWRCPNYEMEI
jgi:hypothetical protein